MPSMSSKEKRRRVEKLRSVIQCNEKQAKQLLETYGWDVNVSTNAFFEGKLKAESSIDVKSVDSFFDKYADEDDKDFMEGEGISQLCEELAIDPTSDLAVLVLSLHMNAKSMGVWTREEFREGMRSLECSSLAALKRKLPSLRRELEDDDRFKVLYNYCFGFALEERQRSLPLALALPLWKILLPSRFQLLDSWLEFMEGQRHSVSRDTWTLLLEFASVVLPDFSNFDEDGAWPVVIDEFVEFMKEKEKKMDVE